MTINPQNDTHKSYQQCRQAELIFEKGNIRESSARAYRILIITANM